VDWGSPANKAFSGVFDGNGKTISDFKYTATAQDHVGLFIYVAGQIKNLGLINPTVVGQGYGTGSLVGYLNLGTLTGCYAESANVSGNYAVGGLVGVNDGGMSDCHSTGSIQGVRFVGGVAGLVNTGGVGRCYSKARVSGSENVGGLAGRTAADDAAIQNCYAGGPVNGSIYVGGLVGQVERGAVYRCYSTGKVIGAQYAGGLVGYTRLLGTVLNCLWDTQSSGQLTSSGGQGKTTAEMKTQSTFTSAGWDFFNTWAICEGVNYPVFWWQIPAGDFRCPDGVNFIDFAWFAQYWRQSDCNASNDFCSGADLNKSSSVYSPDLAIFAENWLGGVE
jgi:hypothetical protein